MTKLDKITSEGWEVEFDDLFGVGGAYNNENLWEVFGSIKQFIAQEKQLSKQEGIEEARKNRNAEPAWATEMENRRLKANPPCWNKNY